MKPLNDLVSSVCRSVSLYSKYFDEKKKITAENSSKTEVEDNSTLQDFSVKRLKKVIDKHYITHLRKLKSILQEKMYMYPLTLMRMLL